MTYLSKIWVTGADGQLGCAFRKYYKPETGSKVSFYSKDELDITNEVLLLKLIKQDRPDVIINCASYTAVDQAESEEKIAYLINEKGVDNLAKACERYNTLLIHFSTDYVYHHDPKRPLKEDDMTIPQGIYAHSKLAGEKKIMQSSCRSMILRTSWVYSEFGKNFLKTMFSLSKDRTQLNIVNDQIGCPTYAKDIVEMVKIMIDRYRQENNLSLKEVYNFTNQGIISWYDFAVEIFALSHIHMTIIPIPSSSYPTPAKRPKWSVLDTSKIENHYQIKMRNWKSSLKEAIANLTIA